MLRPYKFIIQAVVQNVEDYDDLENGNREQVVGEISAEPVEVYGVAGLEKWAREFPDKLAAAKTAE